MTVHPPPPEHLPDADAGRAIVLLRRSWIQSSNRPVHIGEPVGPEAPVDDGAELPAWERRAA